MAIPARSRTLGVFGGSFDPPHLGHALLVGLLRARGELDGLVVAPVFDHPLAKRTKTPFAKRLAWTRAAMQMHADFAEVTDLERTLAQQDPSRPSYSLRLLDAVAQANPRARVRLVIGSDIVARGETARWHRWDRIEAEYDPLVVPRSGFSHAEACALPKVSSSQVREAMAREDWDAVREHVPANVAKLLAMPDRGTIWLIGSGHVARHAEPWLVARGWNVQRLRGRSVVRGELRWPSEAPQAVWVLTSDGAIEAVATALAQANVLPEGVPVFHGAGARRGRALLGPLAPKHPLGSLHPICALRRERSWPSLLDRATFGLEGDPPARAFLEALVGDQPALALDELDANARLAYHAACALAANHFSVLEDVACNVLREQGHEAQAVTDAIRLLMRSALENLHALGIPQGITGPMSRGDTQAVQAHLKALDPTTRDLYAMLSDRLGALVNRS